MGSNMLLQGLVGIDTLTKSVSIHFVINPHWTTPGCCYMDVVEGQSLVLELGMYMYKPKV